MGRILYHKGDLYPDSTSGTDVFFQEWENHLDESSLDFMPTVAVLPYGSFEKSGITSYITLSNVDFSSFSRVVVVGPSHDFVFEGISILAEETIEMLSGEERNVDLEYTFDLKKRHSLATVTGAHRAMSTEVLFPLIEKFTALPLVEIVYGAKAEEQLPELIRELAIDDTTLLIISCTLSKHHCEKEAHSIDRHIINGIMSLSADDVLCGESLSMPALKALVVSLDRSLFSSEVLDYRTCDGSAEGETTGGVEGYLGALLGPIKKG